mmetsp:Transcript_2882/g.6798  ORF Transcript_2882/g.6798 Transcript_2882/m.6798 type:complete len:117 (+) Transcript_2882:38-388(+)
MNMEPKTATQNASNEESATTTQERRANNSKTETKEDQVIRYGCADPPDPSSDFPGRGGTWHCENCNTSKLLAPHTKQWTCSKCKKVMYTRPPDECPLDTFMPCCCWDKMLGGGGGR